MNTDTKQHDGADAGSRPELSLVMPVYNEEESIGPLVERLERLLDSLAGTAVEVIFVDDHSTDGTQALLRAVCQRDARYRHLRLARNSGSHVAILAGLEHARGVCATFMASDLQDPPELIPQMLKLWREGNHVVWAVRERREGIPLVDRVFAGLFWFLLARVGRVDLPPQGSDFALLDRAAIDALLISAGTHPSLAGEIAVLGFRQAQVPYTKARRQYGRGKWNLSRKLQAFADAFVSFSYVPLRAMSYLGMACSVLGFLYALVVVMVRVFSSRKIEGWASLMVVVLVLGGIQMTMLGVLGEYLWRTLSEARRRPRYFLEEGHGYTAGGGDKPPAE